MKKNVQNDVQKVLHFSNLHRVYTAREDTVKNSSRCKKNKIKTLRSLRALEAISLNFFRILEHWCQEIGETGYIGVDSNAAETHEIAQGFRK